MTSKDREKSGNLKLSGNGSFRKSTYFVQRERSHSSLEVTLKGNNLLPEGANSFLKE